MADRSDSERPDSEEHGILDEERVDTSGIFLGGSTAQVDVAFPVPADDDDTIDEDFDESGHDRDVTHPDAAERADTNWRACENVWQCLTRFRLRRHRSFSSTTLVVNVH